MTGYVDDARRALLEVPVRNRAHSPETTITVWIDTAFTGFFVFSKTLILSLDLKQLLSCPSTSNTISPEVLGPILQYSAFD